MEKTCENCGTRILLGCSAYRAEDCGPEFKEWSPQKSEANMNSEDDLGDY